MNTRSQIIIIIFAVLIVTGSVRPQSPLLTNPSSLSQFPTVEQVKAGTKGSDDVDSHARFMAALYRLNSIIMRDLVTAPNGGVDDVPPAANAVRSRYSSAAQTFSLYQPPPAARDPRYPKLVDKYEQDPVFLDSLLTQFFAPKFRTDYYAWVRKPVPQIETKGGNASGVVSVDPSIAKAKAAKVDLTVFGLEIGQPVQLPVCRDFEINQPTCVNTPADGFPIGRELLEKVMQVPSGSLKTVIDPNFLDITLDEAHCPDWAGGLYGICNLKAILENGRLVAVTIETKGRSVEKAANAELKTKYGSPTGIFSGKITPDVGNAFEVRDPVWILPGLRVEYQVIKHSDDSNLDIRFGWVRVITESAYQRITAPKPVKKKM